MNGIARRQIGMLDFGVVPIGGHPRTVIATTLRAVALSDELGFGRYWLAEHHAVDCAWGNPTPLVALIGAASKRIRIGTGGTLLNVHDPLAVASDFALLAWLFPNRVDLGLARGLPATNLTRLVGDHTADHLKERYEQRIAELLDRLGGKGKTAHLKDPLVCATVPRAPQAPPDCWVLGTSASGARLAAELGTAFAFSLFHSEKPNASVIDEYRARFVPGVVQEPKVAIAVAAVCGESHAEVRSQATGQVLKGNLWPTFCGTPHQCRDSMLELQQLYKPDLQVLLDLSTEPDARLRSIELLATVLD
jgi:luciferase family oxidoreductase group 1